MPYACPTCRSTAARELDVAEHYDVLKFATAPELKCPDCSGPTTCAASETLLAHLPSLPKPDPSDARLQQLKRFRDEALKKARTIKSIPPTTPPLGLPQADAPLRAGGVSWSTVLVVIGLFVVAGGGFLVWQSLKSRARGSEVEAVLEISSPEKPAWVDNTFFREADRLLFVGRSTLVADKSEGFAEAEHAALEEVANQIGLSIRDPQWIDFVRQQFDAHRVKVLGDLQKATESGDAAELERARRVVREARRRVAESLRKTAGGLAPTERNDAYWEKLKTPAGPRYVVSVRFAVPKANFEKLVESYQTPESAMGAQAVSYFPSLGWRYDATEGAVIEKVANDSPLRFAGIQEGDLVLAGMDRVVHDARSWKRVLDEESAALAHAKSGGALVLKVQRGDAPAVDTRLRAVAERAGGQGSADPGAKLLKGHRPSTATGNKGRNQTGNIWDDNPEE